MQASPSHPPSHLADLSVSPVERTTSMVLAMVAILGLVVACLFIAWLGSQVLVMPKAVPVTLAASGGSAQGSLGESRELAGLDPNEAAQQTDLVEPEMGDVMSIVLDAVGDVEGSFGLESAPTSGGARASGRQHGTGHAAALGVGEGTGGFPRAQRWEIHFPSGTTLDEYAKALDYFGIELGVIGLGNDVFYASRFGQETPLRRTGPRGDESRLYMSWQKGPLVEADRELIRRAGIETTGKVLVQFFPPELEGRLAQLEKAYANRDDQHILRTRFGVRRMGNGYEFYVLNQTPRVER